MNRISRKDEAAVSHVYCDHPHGRDYVVMDLAVVPFVMGSPAAFMRRVGFRSPPVEPVPFGSVAQIQ